MVLAMPYTTTHHLLSFGGTMPGNETWTMGLRIGGVAGGADPVALLETYAPVLSAAWGAQTISNKAVKLLWCKLNLIGLDGKYASKESSNTHEFVAPGIDSGGQLGPLYPNQVTMVVSLLTKFARGLAHHGRLYFPMPGINVTADGRISAAEALTAAASAKAFIDSINAAGDGTVVIASKERTGAQHTVTQTRVGRVLDTMRSRRTSLDEAYTVNDLDPTGFSGGGGPF